MTSAEQLYESDPAAVARYLQLRSYFHDRLLVEVDRFLAECRTWSGRSAAVAQRPSADLEWRQKQREAVRVRHRRTVRPQA